MKQGLLTFILIFLSGISRAHAAAAVHGTVNFQGDVVHAEFGGRANWDYDLKRVKKGSSTWTEVVLDPLDSTSAKAFANFKSDFVRSVKIDPRGPDGKTIVAFELASDQVESFDYLTDQPSRLVVDFYLKETPKTEAKAAAKPAAKPAAKAEPKKSAKADAKGKTSRSPASDLLSISKEGAQIAAGFDDKEVRGGIFDGGDPDYDRFSVKDYEIKESAILRSKENYYIPFPMLQQRNEMFDKIRAAQPQYAITPKDGDENKMARLLLTLFERKRYAVYLKTLGWFREKYPESQYNDLLAYMTADVHLARWDEKKNADDYDQAVQAYRSAVQKYPGAPPAERASFLLGALALERGDNLAAIRAFHEHQQNPKFGTQNVYSKDLAALGTGFASMKLFRSDDAFRSFDELEKKTSFPDLRAEAAYRKGDVFVAGKQYVRAIEEYDRALKNYPKEGAQHPGATYNRAEALFQTGGYRPALDGYREFVKRFPSDDQAPFAMTRLGELLEILGADPTRVVGAYLETSFRYGENPKAIIARLRLLSARMKGMKKKDTDNAVKEILSLAHKLDLPGIEQFATVLIADGYTGRGEYDRAIALLTDFYQANPTSPDLEPLRKRIISNIADKFRSEVESGDFIKALRTHQKYADGWLKSADRLDTKYYLGRAFELSGVAKEAEALYKDVLNRMFAVRGTPQEKSLSVLQSLPSTEVLHLRLAAVADKRKNPHEAYEQLRLIKQPEKMSEEEQIERVDLAVRLLESRGDLDSASRYLTELLRTWAGKPELVAAPYLRLAEIEMKQGRKDAAADSLRKIDVLMKDSGKVAADVHAKALEMLGDLQLAQGASDKAAETFGNLLNTYEEKRPLASIRYRLGRIHFDRGELQKAAEVWGTFKGERSGFWKNLAQEQLRNSEWRGDYKKYLKRIPAMVEKE